MSKKEVWEYQENERVWVGKYLNSQNISHWHYDCELLYICKGNLDVMFDKTKYSLTKGDSFFIESKKIHNMQAKDEDTIVLVFIFDFEIIRKIMGSYELFSPLLTYDYKLPTLYQEFLNELKEKPPFYEIKTKAKIEELFIEIMRREALSKKKKIKKIDEKLMSLLNDIENNYQNYTLEDAVKKMEMNPSYFSRFFHNTIGIPFSKYLNCVKVEHAVEFLHSKSKYTMTEIAIECGFQTIRNFNRIVKAYTGYAPTTIPINYTFNGLKIYANGNEQNPTLNNCKLIEFSSPH